LASTLGRVIFCLTEAPKEDSSLYSLFAPPLVLELLRRKESIKK